MKKSLANRIIVGITGRSVNDLRNKIIECDKYKLTRVSLFLEIIPRQKDRILIYELLLSSGVKEIPLVHIRDNMDNWELKFLEKNFKTKCFTIHESGFKYLNEWRGFHDKIFLENNYDGYVSSLVRLKKIGGFCIDLSHFKSSQTRWTEDFDFVIERNDIKRYFVGNHLNGYTYKRKKDLHTVRYLRDFDYLKTLPKFVFGKYIAIETFNSIREQLRFKRYIMRLLSNKI